MEWYKILILTLVVVLLLHWGIPEGCRKLFGLCRKLFRLCRKLYRLSKFCQRFWKLWALLTLCISQGYRFLSSEDGQEKDDEGQEHDDEGPEDPAGSSKDASENYQVVVYGLMGEEMIIGVCNTEKEMQSMTVGQLKKKILQRLPKYIEADALRLIFTDRMLEEDSARLSEYGIQHKSPINLVMKVPGGPTA